MNCQAVKTGRTAEQWKDAQWVGKLKRADEHVLVIRGMTRSAGAGRRQARDEKWNLGSVKAVLNRIQELTASTQFDTSVARQKYIVSQALNKHRRSPLCTRCARDTRFEIMWTKEFAEAEVANRTVDAVPIDPNVRVSESVEPAAAARGQPAAMEVNTDGQRDVRGNTGQTSTRKLVRNPVVERAGGAAPQLDVSQAQPMDVPLDQKATTIAINNVESGIGDLRSVAGHQAEQADSMLPTGAMKYSANTMADVSHSFLSITLESCGTETSALQSIPV